MVVNFLLSLLCLQIVYGECIITSLYYLGFCFITAGENYNISATSFYFGLMRGYSGYLTISTLSPLNVTYHITVDSLNYTRNGIVTKNRPLRSLYLPFHFQTHSGSFADRFKGIHVKSDQPIRLLLFDYVTSSYLLLPCHEYPGVSQYEYYTVSTSSYRNTSLSEALLVGCSNNTNITIVPSVDLFIPLDAQVNGSVDILVTKGRSHTITLHEGQTLLLGKGNGSDISGTRIISNKPLTVITGHECGSTPDMIEQSSCDPLHLQVPPTVTWGKRFILANFGHYTRSILLSYVKIVTSKANTTVAVYCNGTTNTTRYSVGVVGTYHYNITDYCFVEADKLIFVVLFPHTYFYQYTSMVLIPPMEQYLQEIEFDLYNYDYSKLVITTSIEGFSPTAILHNGQATLNWTAIHDSSQNIVAYGMEIDITTSQYRSNHSVIHNGRNGKLSVQVQTYNHIREFFSHPAVVLLQPSK